jgi:hypothetical protein
LLWRDLFHFVVFAARALDLVASEDVELTKR